MSAPETPPKVEYIPKHLIDWPAIAVTLLALAGFAYVVFGGGTDQVLLAGIYLTLVAILVAVLRGQREE